ncbi:MAG: response regulator [Candidatus Bathyarchaeota archaeon]|nr:response regulator [Candidatus Bathyarchaeota archaeon]MDH5733767.1 response regulator [Candidatus Bathyarchaeota archaeon]
MKKTSILIVDDNEGIRETLSSILEEKGYDTDTAKNGAEAIEKSKTKFYNIALLDIKLPDVEGTKLLTEMQETSPKMIKIMITGYASLQNAVEALNLGANAYIMKPLNPENLLNVITEKSKTQRKSETMNQKKVVEWIKTRTLKLERDQQVKA